MILEPEAITQPHHPAEKIITKKTITISPTPSKLKHHHASKPPKPLVDTPNLTKNQLIILTGYPCSGLTHRAYQLSHGLEAAQTTLFSETSAAPKPKNRYKIHVVHTHDNANYKRMVYDAARTEKEARGIAYTRAKRMLGKDSIVVLDGMNYIKGYRYQLWCEAKALGTTCCVVCSYLPTSPNLGSQG